MHNDVGVDSGLFPYLDVVMLSCILSHLYHNLSQSDVDAYLVPIVLVCILHCCTFLVQI